MFNQIKRINPGFSTAQDVVLDPELNELLQARLALHSLPGLLTKHDLVIS